MTIESICEHCVINDADRQCQYCGDYICDDCASHALDADYNICKACYGDHKEAQGE